MLNKGKHVHSIVRWCDVDAFGDVNNSVFLSYFESIRMAKWKKVTPSHISFRDIDPLTYPKTLPDYMLQQLPEKIA